MEELEVGPISSPSPLQPGGYLKPLDGGRFTGEFSENKQ